MRYFQIIILIFVFLPILSSFADDRANINLEVEIPKSVIPPSPVVPTSGTGSSLSAVSVTFGSLSGAAILGLSAYKGVSYYTGGLATGLAAKIKVENTSCKLINQILDQPNIHPLLNKGIRYYTPARLNGKQVVFLSDSLIQSEHYKSIFIDVPDATNKITVVELSRSLNNPVSSNPLKTRVFFNITSQKIDKIFKTQKYKNGYIPKSEIPLMNKKQLYSSGILQKETVIQLPGKLNNIALVTTFTSKIVSVKQYNYAYIIIFECL